MRFLEKLSVLTILFMVFTALLINVQFILGIGISWLSLPLSFLMFNLIILIIINARRSAFNYQKYLISTILITLLFISAAKAISIIYDSSWDGQDYHQSAIVALHSGWNPWRQNKLPTVLPQSAEYVIGYPKTTWYLEAGVYELFGYIQTAKVVNLLAAIVAGILAFGALRRLSVNKAWSIVITVLAVLQVHFLQQLPTFMEDGYSYELSLAAISSMIIFIKDEAKLWPMAAFICAWLLMAGSKFSNLPILAMLGLAMLVILWRTNAYRQKNFIKLILAGTAAGVLLLFVPYGSNMMRFGSPFYPINLPEANNKLLSDNIPSNLKNTNRLELLFYGIFSRIEPSEAGNPSSPQNTAQLKFPFSFEPYEFAQIANFQGRLASSGVFFSGVMIVAFMGFGFLLIVKKPRANRNIYLGLAISCLLILISAILTPVPNKLRYSPQITLIPLLVAVSLILLKSKSNVINFIKYALVAAVILNLAVSFAYLSAARYAETSTINNQLQALKVSGKSYEVLATHLYSSYTRLSENKIPIKITSQLNCSQPFTLEYTNWTTYMCKIP